MKAHIPRVLFPVVARIYSNLHATVITILLVSAPRPPVTAAFIFDQFLLAISVTVNNAPGRDRRAELNGLSITIESLARAISPMACSALFAFSTNGNYPYPFEYHFVFYLLGSIRLVAACTGWNRITDNGNME